MASWWSRPSPSRSGCCPPRSEGGLQSIGRKEVAARWPPLCQWPRCMQQRPGETSARAALAVGELLRVDGLDTAHLAVIALGPDQGLRGAEPVLGAFGGDADGAGQRQRAAVAAEGQLVMRIGVAQQHAAGA